MSRFFINRPIFAWVIAILIMMGGTLALLKLPVAQYPNIASPQVVVTTQYPGASAKTVEDTVTQVIEQQMSGIDNLIYMSSTSESSGTATLTFTFETGTDIDIAQVQVQNKLQLAQPLLPEEVQRQGISVTKSSVGVLLILSYYSEDGSMKESDIGDYIGSNVKDSLSRIPGVGSLTYYGAQYALRVWCDPAKFEQYKLNPSDIIEAIREQNSQVTGGQVGAYPAVRGQEINITVNASSRLESVEEFNNIIIRTNPDGSLIRLSDVARIELNSETFNTTVKANGLPGVGLAFMLASGANALDTAAAIKSKVEAQAAFFPPGLNYLYTYDTTLFVEISIKAVFKTLGEAILLVFLVMYLFLQNFRSTLIPTVAVPVVLLGTFGVLAAAGYSINTLTMFGMVLAIGLLVDDAIVVVENVERLMREEGLTPKAAALKSMEQITGALVGVALVIAAVFVPMAFMGGSVGVIYRQFSMTIVTAMALSAMVALILTPAMCATMLSPHSHSTSKSLAGRFYSWFNNWFERRTLTYQSQVGRLLAKPLRCLPAFAIGLLLIGFLFYRLPTSFLPDEDQGALFAVVQMPPGATFERTNAVLDEVRRFFREDEGENVAKVMTAAGRSFSGGGQSSGQAYVSLAHWDVRKGKDRRVEAIMNRARAHFSTIPDAHIFVVAPPPVMELGDAAGFEFELMDLTGRGHDALMEARDILLTKARQHPALRNVRHSGLEDVEQYTLDIDLAKAGALSLSKGVINQTIAAYWGGFYVNDFQDRGRTKKVYVQADAEYRMQADDFDRYHVRNARDEMVPFSSFLSVSTSKGSPRLERYEGVPALKIQGEAAPGRSTGEAMAVMESIAAELPEGFGHQWTGLSYQEVKSGSQAHFLYAISLAVVFLCLAALYESWSIPLSVLLVVPTGILGALIGVFCRGMANDVYFQIGLLTVVGLSAKNSILIVEYARDLHEQGMELVAATREAVRMRLRPIIMTSLAFTLGVLPLAVSTDAGSGAQNAVGTTVICGVLTATALGIYLTPVFFVLVNRLFSSFRRVSQAETPSADGQDAIHQTTEGVYHG